MQTMNEILNELRRIKECIDSEIHSTDDLPKVTAEIFNTGLTNIAMFLAIIASNTERLNGNRHHYGTSNQDNSKTTQS